MERWVCAPHSDPGGISSDPIESDSTRDGSEAMAPSTGAVVGRSLARTPGVKVCDANTCFMVVRRLIEAPRRIEGRCLLLETLSASGFSRASVALSPNSEGRDGARRHDAE